MRADGVGDANLFMLDIVLVGGVVSGYHPLLEAYIAQDRRSCYQ